MENRTETMKGATAEPVYVKVIARHWRCELVTLAIGVSMAVLLALVLPRKYEATASFLPPDDNDASHLLGSLLQGIPMGSSLLGGADPKDVFVSILKSRTVLDDVIREFDLVNVYGYAATRAPMKKARKKLQRMTDVEVSKEGVVSVTAWAYDPTTATRMARYYLDDLSRQDATINTSDAKRTRVFLQEQVSSAQKALVRSEERLTAYQSEHKAVVIEGQTKTAIETAAVLEGQILATEVQLRAAETFATPANPDVVRLKATIVEMRRQLRGREYGKRRVAGPGGDVMGEYSMALGSLPETGLDIARLVRDAKVQETIFLLLTQQLEQARVAEARDTPRIKVLDYPVAPETYTYPSLALSLAIGVGGGLVVGVGAGFCLERYRPRRREVADAA
jgi:uncharacterized protein involved in exopolysaccharide biosynthesis